MVKFMVNKETKEEAILLNQTEIIYKNGTAGAKYTMQGDRGRFFVEGKDIDNWKEKDKK